VREQGAQGGHPRAARASDAHAEGALCGTPAAAALHLARTVARRAERVMVALAQDSAEHVNREGIKYINRVSDLLFVAARAVNDNGNADVLWVPGKNR